MFDGAETKPKKAAAKPRKGAVPLNPAEAADLLRRLGWSIAPPDKPIAEGPKEPVVDDIYDDVPPAPPMPIDRVVDLLRLLQQQRRFCIKTQSRCDRSIESMIAGRLGYRVDMSEKEGKALWSKVRQQRVAAEVGGKLLPEVEPLLAMITMSALSRNPWDDHRTKNVEREMVAFAKSLPVWEWAKDIAGFGPLGLAIIIGEAGASLSNFATKDKLWKRMGLAVINGERQRRKKDELEAEEHGYNPKRRAEMWVLADSLFKKQWRGVDSAYREAILKHPEAGERYKPADLKDLKTKELKEIAEPYGIEAEGYALGPYGEKYKAAKESASLKVISTDNLPDKDKWTPKRANDHARRVMSKKLLKDLWVQWKRLTPREGAAA